MYKELRDLYTKYMAEVINFSELQQLQAKVYAKYSLSSAQGATAWSDMLNGKTDSVVATPTGTTDPLPGGTKNSALETATDSLTAYLSRLGIGGKTIYNPAEQYQAGLFDPFKNLYDIQSRLSSPGGPLQDPTRQSATFSDFLDKIGTGLGGLTQGARGQLQSVFGATSALKPTLGYEPGQYLPGTTGEAGGQMNPGHLGELQDLLQYGLRPTTGILGSKYAAQRLPQAQQAYYGQKAAGTSGFTNFLDWLKSNWGLNP